MTTLAHLFRKIRPALAAAAIAASAGLPLRAQVTGVRTTVTIDEQHPIRTFRPEIDLGAGIDGRNSGEIDRSLSPANIREMLTAGLGPITYRLRTELAIEAWHWNPKGTWSDPSNNSGYWTSDAGPGGEIERSSGYLLPRRGNTIDQAENAGYSRIDDGDETTFWKSNPYLDRAFTGESNDLHQQWIVLDLGGRTPVNSVRIVWGTPFAADYTIQYGDVTDISDISQNPPGLWHDFGNGHVRTNRGGEVVTRFSGPPVSTRFIRVLLKTNNAAGVETGDLRDRAGFAVREIYAGMGNGGGISDVVRHGRQSGGQSAVYVSSTDPWHAAGDRDPNTEQPGFDWLYKSGLTRGRPVMIPVGVLFDTPENAAAEIAYLKSRGFPIGGVEMGEEPDGQYVTPEDYGALYIEFCNAIRKVAPNVRFGGPSFQEILPDTRAGRNKLGNAVWLERFIRYLARRGKSDDFSFMSFEWYPFDNVCEPTAPQIAKAAELLQSYLANFERHGLKHGFPLVMTEYGFSAFSTAAEVDIEGALFNADAVGTFLKVGGAQAYLYGYEPNRIERDFGCTAGNNMLFLGSRDGGIESRTSTYYGAQMMMTEWLQPSGGPHKLYPVEIGDGRGKDAPRIGGYAVRRPDGQWSLILINREPARESMVNIRVRPSGQGHGQSLSAMDEIVFSRESYKWNAELGRPERSEPPVHTHVDAGTREIKLPPYSLTVLRWQAEK